MRQKRKRWSWESEFAFKKMKYSYTYIMIFILACMGCSGDNAPDCLQTSGDSIREEIILPDFTRITVFERIELVLVPGNTQRVEVETGENLRNEISARVEGDRLILRNENACNLFRSYGKTKFYVTAPNLEEIRSSTGLSVRSAGTLELNALSLLSESFLEPEAETTDGAFELSVNAEVVNIITNGIAYFSLTGSTERLNITIAAGDSRVEAQSLQAQDVSLDHRGSNDILIRPEASLSGVIRGTGNVIGYNRPDVVDVDILYKGELIFID